MSLGMCFLGAKPTSSLRIAFSIPLILYSEVHWRRTIPYFGAGGSLLSQEPGLSKWSGAVKAGIEANRWPVLLIP